MILNLQCCILVGLLGWSCAYRIDAEKNDLASERVQLRSLSRRSLDGSRTLQLSAFGKDHVLRLKPTEIFTSDFEFLQVNQDTNGNTKFLKVREDKGKTAKNNGQLYEVNDGKGTLFITDDDAVQAEGVINDELRIVPNDNDFHEDGSLAHTVHQMKATDFVQEKDFVIPEFGKFSFEESEFSTLEDVPAEVTVEVLVAFDHANSKRLDFDVEKIRKYVGIFWSQIHYRYRDTTKPKINIAVSGLLTFNKPEDEPFILKHKSREDRVEKGCLGSFREWLKANKASLTKHDAAIIQLGLDSGETVNGTWNYGLAGLAYVGTACNADGYNSGFAEDTARLFDGFNAAAHELAHILAAPHDGDGKAKNCPAGAGFVMSGGQKKTFSTCSIEIMGNYISSNKGKCMWDSPTIAVPLIDVWPVLMVENLTEHCSLMFDSQYYFAGTVYDFCEKFWCNKIGSAASWVKRGAYEGTPCGFNKVCFDKKCTDKPTPSLDKQCQQQFGNQFKATKTENVCQNVECVDSESGSQKSLGRPLPGTPCGNQDFCLNGMCYVCAANGKCKPTS